MTNLKVGASAEEVFCREFLGQDTSAGLNLETGMEAVASKRSGSAFERGGPAGQ
jgi:hypothetical protein